jgi:hypothetical protein
VFWLSNCAVALPIPDPAPVIMMVFWDIEKKIISKFSEAHEDSLKYLPPLFVGEDCKNENVGKEHCSFANSSYIYEIQFERNHGYHQKQKKCKSRKVQCPKSAS